MMSKYKQFISFFFIFTFLFSLPFLTNLIFLYNAFEIMGFNDIVDIQSRNNAIYCSKFNQNHFSYKLKMVELNRPIIISLGSSVVMQMRDFFFNESFINCGRGMNSLNEGRLFLEKMISFHTPKTIILGLDFWWFNENCRPDDIPDRENDGKDITYDKLTEPTLLVLKGTISIKTYIDIILGHLDHSKITKYKKMGFLAISTSDGFRKDGSFLYGGVIFGFRDSEDKKFLNTVKRIDKADMADKFAYGNNLPSERIKELNEIITLCNRNDIKLVIIIPPVAKAVYSKITSMGDKYSYIEKLRKYIRNLPVESYDFYDVSDMNISDCEFIDGFHCGDVTYQKILLRILEINPNSCIKDYLNVNLMKKCVKKFDGKVLTIIDEGTYCYQEVDFLELGCKK